MCESKPPVARFCSQHKSLRSKKPTRIEREERKKERETERKERKKERDREKGEKEKERTKEYILCKP